MANLAGREDRRVLGSEYPPDWGHTITVTAGDHVVVESEQIGQPARGGVIEEVLGSEAHPRYRILWDDGHESIYTPAAGALHAAGPHKA
jgi:hypothetical protein